MLKLKKMKKNYEKNNKLEMKNTKQNYLENNEENCKNKNKDKTKHSGITQYKSIFEFRFNIFKIFQLFKFNEVKDEHPENILFILPTKVELKKDKSISDIFAQFKNIDSVDAISIFHIILTIFIFSSFSSKLYSFINVSL